MTEFKAALKEMMERKLKEYEMKEELTLKAYNNQTIYYTNSEEIHETDLASNNLMKFESMYKIIEKYLTEEKSLSDEELLGNILTEPPFYRSSKLLRFNSDEKKLKKEEKRDEIVVNTVKDILLLYKATA